MWSRFCSSILGSRTSKAFDTIDHQKLLYKLNSLNGIRVSLINSLVAICATEISTLSWEKHLIVYCSFLTSDDLVKCSCDATFVFCADDTNIFQSAKSHRE